MIAMGRGRWIAAAALVAGGVACGLSAVGTATNEDAPIDAGDDRSSAPDVIEPVDAGTDATADALPDVLLDALLDTTCPNACNGGCDGGVCTIDCAAVGDCNGNNVNCPEGRPCHVRCTDTDRCSNKTIKCPSAAACRIDCIADQACQTTTFECGTGACRITCGDGDIQGCNGSTVSAALTAQLCLSCTGKMGNPGCNSLTCTVQSATCRKDCNGNGCNSIGNCGTCADIDPCP